MALYAISLVLVWWIGQNRPGLALTSHWLLLLLGLLVHRWLTIQWQARSIDLHPFRLGPLLLVTGASLAFQCWIFGRQLVDLPPLGLILATIPIGLLVLALCYLCRRKRVGDLSAIRWSELTFTVVAVSLCWGWSTVRLANDALANPAGRHYVQPVISKIAGRVRLSGRRGFRYAPDQLVVADLGLSAGQRTISVPQGLFQSSHVGDQLCATIYSGGFGMDLIVPRVCEI